MKVVVCVENVLKLHDQHVHTRFSSDSEADPADNVRAAVTAGLAGITFTDHLDSHPIEAPLCRYDYDGLAKTVGQLREQFGSQVFVGLGIEICYQPEHVGAAFAQTSQWLAAEGIRKLAVFRKRCCTLELL